MAAEGLSLAYQNILKNHEMRSSRVSIQNKTSSNWVFGKPGEKDVEGAKEITTSWRFHTPSRSGSRQKDFRSLNKKNVKRGMSTSKDFRAALKSETLFTQPAEGTASISLIIPDEDFIYGHPNKPSTPLNNILAHAYGAHSAMVTQEIYKARLVEAQRKTTHLPKVVRAIPGIHSSVVGKEDAEEKTFKLKKFDGIKAKVHTTNNQYIAHMRSASCDSRSMRNL